MFPMMKKEFALYFWLSVTFAFCSFGLNSSVKAKPSEKVVKKKSNTQKVVLQITGMTCGGCAAKVSNTLKHIKGVKKVDVSLEKGKAIVICSKKSKTSVLQASVKKLGYGATLVSEKDKKKRKKK